MAVTFPNYYETLGVGREASAEEIKLAFRKLARVHHPDVAKDKVTGEAKFKEINEAYEVLGDPEKRRRYDELGPDGSAETDQATSTAGTGDPGDFEFGGTGFSDFFESFFGGGRSGFSSADGMRSPNRTEPGRDIEADLLVTLEEALRGSKRKVTLRRPGIAGAGERSDTYQVRIPAGMRENQRIRLAGQGGPGHGGAAAGDLYLRVRFARHPDLSVKGDDLYAGLDLAPWEAVLGVKVQVAALGGPITLTVPPGTAAGTQLRVRGHGLARADGSRGDLHAVAHVRMPPTVSAEERALWQQLSRLSTFNPRSSP